jgi:hypothetical protein
VRTAALLACVLVACGAWAVTVTRIEVRSADIVVVGLMQGERMGIHVSRVLDNAPVRDAIVTVAFRGASYPAVAQVDGGYSLQAKELALPGAVALEFHVVAGGIDEKLSGTLEVEGAAPKPDEHGSARQYLWWVLNFAVCGAFLVLWARRRKRAEP